MKKHQIRSIEPVSAFKATIYLSLIPMALMSVIGVLLTIAGILFDQSEITIIGVTYIFMPLIMIVIYGLFSMLGALVYSKLAERFGGLEITLVEKESDHSVTQPPSEVNQTDA